MLHNKPFIMMQEDGSSACYMNPKAFFMCPKCFQAHAFQAHGSIILENDTMNAIKAQVVPRVMAECFCGYSGELFPIGEDFIEPIQNMTRKGYYVGAIAGDKLHNGNIRLSIQFDNEYSFTVLPAGWALIGKSLVAEGQEAALIENLTVWAREHVPTIKE